MTDSTDTRRPHRHSTTHPSEAPMTDVDGTCPVCESEITGTRKVGEVTYELDPCGHEVDEGVHEDLVEN